ncbi:MAG: hypothetical protein MK132_15710 [Lentisphaerales bacterium]|nr:hypothetical protein [Lentisphaerales bacterium]
MEEFNGIIKENAHPRAQDLVPHDFFWDYLDELTPFGSDEGHNALVQFREWRKDNPETPLADCLSWMIAGIGDLKASDYNDAITTPEYISKQLEDDEFDDDYFIYTLDAYVIGVGFGQLADEGKIDEEAKPIISTALSRQANWAGLDDNEINREYIGNIKILQAILIQA